MLDVDHFKQVNDLHGHAAGDRALRAIAETLRTNTRVFDSVARYGGEEFVIVMPGSSPDEAIAAAERLRASVEAMTFAPEAGRIYRLSVSIGVACGETGFETPEALLHGADIALYAAKHAGRNRVELAPAAPIS
jgi:two-component system cell cycle response regulator